MKAFSALLALCVGIHRSPITDEFPTQEASNADFGVFFDVSLNKRLHKQLWAGDLRRHDGRCDVTVMIMILCIYIGNKNIGDKSNELKCNYRFDCIGQ